MSTWVLARCAVIGVTLVAAAPLRRARFQHTATLLPDGGILVAGGWSEPPDSGLTSAEIRDPQTGLWTATGAMGTGRCRHSATLLPDGRVLVVGGIHGEGSSAAAEAWNPATGGWGDAGSLAAARYDHGAVLLGNGRVLVAGGHGDGVGSTAEICPSLTP